MINNTARAVYCALSAALFYALNVPLSKVLLQDVSPIFMASFMYLGAGLGVGIIYLYHWKNESSQERLNMKDTPYVLGMILLDIAAPILMMYGVKFGTASNASLLGNLETPATALIALVIFHERISRQLWAAIALITLSGMLLTLDIKEGLEFSSGSLFVLGAALCWGLENNCTNSISSKSAYEIVTLKGICSGAGAFMTGLAAGDSVPDLRFAVYALMLGFVAYGLSIFMYIRAQNVLGAAKTSAYYASAPFIAAVLSFVLLGEELSSWYAAAFAIMTAGTALAVRDTLHRSHVHEHKHIIIHVHGGRLHSHIMMHSHPHEHYLSGSSHIHLHKGAD